MSNKTVPVTKKVVFVAAQDYATDDANRLENFLLSVGELPLTDVQLGLVHRILMDAHAAAFIQGLRVAEDKRLDVSEAKDFTSEDMNAFIMRYGGVTGEDLRKLREQAARRN